MDDALGEMLAERERRFEQGYVKLFVDIDGRAPETAWHDAGGESFWAVPTGDGYYELHNTPFYAYGLAWGDIVEGIPHDDYPNYVDFVRVRRSGGHSTLRLILGEAGRTKAVQDRFDRLNALGCGYEGTGAIDLYAWDVSSETDIEAVLDILDAGEGDGLWTYEYAHVERIVR